MASQSIDGTFEQPSDITAESGHAFYNHQAKTINAAAVLLRTVDDEVVLVKPSYRDVWHLPGGLLDEDESPRQAAQREVQEELGLDVPVNTYYAWTSRGPHWEGPPASSLSSTGAS